MISHRDYALCKKMYISKQKFCDCSEVSCGDTAVMFDISHISVTVSLQAFCQLNVSHVLVLKSHLLCLKFISHCIKPIRTCSVLEYQNIKIKENRYDLYFMPVVKLTSHSAFCQSVVCVTPHQRMTYSCFIALKTQ